MEGIIESKCERLIVVGMDFGITTSGCAFSFKDDWSRISMVLNSKNIPSVVLLNNRAEFVAFGFDAEDKYATLKEDGTHMDYHLFRSFGRILHEDTVRIITYIVT